MKKLKFEHALVNLILNGDKTSTWRLFDDKDLRVGDEIELVEFDTGEVFAHADISHVTEKTMGEITASDFDRHEKYKDRDEMLATYRGYYGTDRVDWSTPVKIVEFDLSK